MRAATPFDGEGAWLRCALHAHTTSSDGELAPDRLALHYARAGYDVLCITDHWVRSSVPDAEGILVIPGAELNAAIDGTGSDAHVLGLGIEADPVEPGRSFPNLQATVDWILASGGLPFLAHPYWSGLRLEEFARCDGLLGVEVYNAGCELEIGRGLSAAQWDEALESGERLLALATDDSHLPGFDSGFGSVWVRAADRSREGVLDALRDGRFYSSTGPRLEHVAVTSGHVEVRCTPAASVTLVSARTAGARVNAGRMGYRNDVEAVEEDADGLVVGARLRRRSWGMSYGRVEVADPLGRRAWTNPLWYDEG
jgi:predicted metal-dependent phosphoesterase TrpH